MTARTPHVRGRDGRERRSRPRPAPPVDTWRGERPWPATALPPGAREEDFFHHGEPNVSLAFVKHEAIVVAGLVGGLVVLSLIVGLVILLATGGGSLVLVPLLVGYMALLALPVWAAAIADDADHYRSEHDEQA